MPKSNQKNNGLYIIASATNNKAVIRIVDYIESDYDERNMRWVVDDFLTQGIKEADVYLNTRGGDVFAAAEMVRQLSRFDKVVITAGALVASAGTFFMAKFYTRAYQNSQFMVHKPSMVMIGNEDQVSSQAKGLKNVTEDYRNAYAAKTGMTTEQIEELWAKGDYWMNAAEAFEKGFIDEIIAEELEVKEEDVALLTACAAPCIPSEKTFNHKNHKHSKMDRLALIAALALAADVTDEQIEAAVVQNKKAADAYQAKLQAEEGMRKLNVKKMVETALAEKRITAEEVAPFTALAESSEDGFKQVEKVLSLKPKVGKLSAELSGHTNPSAAHQDGEKWNLDQWLENDPEGLAKMEAEDPERFKALNQAYFKS